MEIGLMINFGAMSLQFKTKESEMFSGSQILWGFLFGSVGLGFFIYGKKQSMIVPILCGLGLMIYPYFVASTIALILIGCVLIAIPYFFRY